jgi:hypothetical protein
VGKNTVSLRYYVEARFKALEKATRLALTEREKAIDKAEKAIGERLTLLNELREGVATKEQLDALGNRVAEQKERLDKLEGTSSGKNALWGYVISATVLIATILGIIAFFSK